MNCINCKRCKGGWIQIKKGANGPQKEEKTEEISCFEVGHQKPGSGSTKKTGSGFGECGNDTLRETIPLMGWPAKSVYLREGQRRRAGEWACSAPWQEAGACRSAPIGSQPTNQNPALVNSAHILPITLLNLYIQLSNYFSYQNSIISLTDLRL